MRAFILIAAAALGACQHSEPGIEIRTVEVVREVQKPCPGEIPARPSALEALPAGATAALAVALAKLAEWSAPGKFGDRAEAYFEACPPA